MVKARHCKLNIPWFSRSTFGTQAFSVTNPMVWNFLPDLLHDPAVTSDCFFGGTRNGICARYERIHGIAPYKSTFIYILSYRCIFSEAEQLQQ